MDKEVLFSNNQAFYLTLNKITLRTKYCVAIPFPYVLAIFSVFMAILM